MCKTIYFAGGCFWGTEHLFSLVPGVLQTEAGYANSVVEDPTYRLVCTGVTEAAEAVKVVYDPERVSLEQLIDLFLLSIDPEAENRQGADVGTQYRSGIFYTDAASAEIVIHAMEALDRKLGHPSAIQYGELENFYPAEEYHQAYLQKNPSGYCHVDKSLFRVAMQVGK